MRKRWWLLLLIVGFVLGGGFWLWRAVGVHWVEPHPGLTDSAKKSSDLPGDIKLMWETQQLDVDSRAPTDRAINAASRVFNTAALVGKTREEVVALLGDPKSSSDSVYKFPFWGAPKGALVYRFDSGMYGWQFNVVFGEDGNVSEVERRWIH